MELLAVSELRLIRKRSRFEWACRQSSLAGITVLTRFSTNSLVRVRRGDPDGMLRIDEAFRHQLAELSGNREIVSRIAVIEGRIRCVGRFNHDPSRRRRITRHIRTVAVFKARNAERGMHISAQHISLSVGDAQRVLKKVLFRRYVNQPAPLGRRAA